MDTLMEDPVKLPCKHAARRSILVCIGSSIFTCMDAWMQHTGGTVIDRVTIERSLLDNEINPFSREPMTVDDLVPDDGLKQRIQKWVECRKSGVPFES
eukprot:COSAG02_NODE_13465_length_1391_cov_2.779412_2_plen_98_part_00